MSADSKQTPAGQLREDGLHRILGYQLGQASVLTTTVFTEQVGTAFDLRPVEYTVLMLVHENPGGSAARLAQALAVSAPNITAWLERLDQRGLLQRRPSPTDRRSQLLNLTPKGVALAEEATAKLQAAERAALTALSEGERTILIELLHKVAGQR